MEAVSLATYFGIPQIEYLLGHIIISLCLAG